MDLVFAARTVALVCWCLILSFLVSGTSACFRSSRGGNDKQKDQQKGKPSSATTTVSFRFKDPKPWNSSEPYGHRHNCTEEETQQAACVNSGVCYAVDLLGDGIRSAFCHCVGMETGDRCEQLVFIPPSLEDTSGGLRAKDVVELVVAVLLSLFLLTVVGVFIYKKTRGRRYAIIYHHHLPQAERRDETAA